VEHEFEVMGTKLKIDVFGNCKIYLSNAGAKDVPIDVISFYANEKPVNHTPSTGIIKKGAVQEISFTDLSPGRYKLLVKIYGNTMDFGYLSCEAPSTCGNGVFDSGQEECEKDIATTNNPNCPTETTTFCDTTNKRYGTRSLHETCNEMCKCVEEAWSWDTGTNPGDPYCNNCDHCGDGECNCGENSTTCSDDCGLPPVMAFTCDIVNAGACTDTIVLRVSDTTNAHVGTKDGSTYNKVLCCSAGTGINLYVNIKDGCDATETGLLSLSSLDNSHVEVYNSSNPANPSPNYDNDVCLSTSSGSLDCQAIKDVACPYGYDEIVSLSGITNAHLGGVYDYSVKVCCK